ncbi:primosomal protein N' [Terrimonas rubra]|uniref:Replication restart protein PriA n=1 Tax=Terrimonas rubra TaxID=1035890 RepID=A0ABW6A8M1_9BACT
MPVTENTLFTSTSASSSVYAEVIIPLALPQNYTWRIPEHLQSLTSPGCRVEVNLGKQKKYAGIVKRIHSDKPEFFEPKDILNVLDAEPVVYAEQLKLWEWMATYYMCSEGEVMAAGLPAHFKLSSETIVVYNEEFGDDFTNLDAEEYVVAEALLLKKELKLTEIQLILDSPHVYPVVNRLIHKRVCYVWEALKNTYAPKKETYILLQKAYEQEATLAKLLNEDPKLQRAEKQMELLLAYLHLSKTTGSVTRQALLKKSGASDAQLKGLIAKNILRSEKREVDRIQYLPKDITIDFELSPAQQTAYQQVKESFTDKTVSLLHGVTSSGKTQLYIRLIEEHIKQGKQVLYMLPEIALTSQIIRRLQKHFGGYIGVYHSKFSQNERVEIWNKVKSGELKIILGARSTLFLPFRDLSLIICDEEHDTSYKQQEPAPRYHGRDTAIYFASLYQAKVLLGSATPSLESYYNAQTGKYALIELNERFGDVQMPQIQMIDIRKIERKPNDKEKAIITPDLAKAIEESIARQKQVILFQNRRGYSPYQVCSVCNWVPKCKHCNVSLTFHKHTNQLACHYCGSTYPPLQTCLACGSHAFVQRNFGTEKIEELLQEKFPKAKVARMDIDTVRGKHAHDTLLQQFEQQRIDILVGTQMVVKGLDFDTVALVGILDADGILNFADFRVNERAYQLMEQVSGRAGRRSETGQVLIQTGQPQHPVLQYVQQHAYKKMYADEIDKRKQFAYPPFARIIHLNFKHKIKEVVQQAAQQFTVSLQPKYGNYLTGPAEPIINRIRNQYIMELLIKLPRQQQLIQECKQDIKIQIINLQQQQRFRSVVVIPDVDGV